MENKMQERLIWLDLEMTGLNPDRDSILEIATIITDADLVELAQGPVYAIRHNETVLNQRCLSPPRESQSKPPNIG